MLNKKKQSHYSAPPLKTAGAFMALGLVAVVAFCLLQFRGTFREYVAYTVVSDRSGLVMDPGAKVKLHGVQIGRVSGVSLVDDRARLELEVDPEWSDILPSNVTSQIKAATAFGSKYVELEIPHIADSTTLQAGAVIPSSNVTTEVDTLFESITSLMQHVDPAKLNATLTAISDGLNGRGKVLGETLVGADRYLSALNPHMPQLSEDFRSAAAVSNTYADITPDFMATLDNFTTTSNTVTSQEQQVNGLLLSAIGFGNTGIELASDSEPKFISASNLLVPTTELLEKYSPEYTCFLKGAVPASAIMAQMVDNTGYSADLDAGLMFGDPAYEYPKNLPKINAKGGPGGQPGCYPEITKDLYPAPHLVMDTGATIGGATSLKPSASPVVNFLMGVETAGGGGR